MKWSIGIQAAHRATPSVGRTLCSLLAAGWTDVFVHYDHDRDGDGGRELRPWMTLLNLLLRTEADVYSIVEDDVICCRGLRGYLEQSIAGFPHPEIVSFYSSYACNAYNQALRTKLTGWRPQSRGLYLVGSCFLAIPAGVAKRIAAGFANLREEPADKIQRIDYRLGEWASEQKLVPYYHCPSLVQHVGMGNSARGETSTNADLLTAGDFVGEDFDAMSLVGSAPCVS